MNRRAFITLLGGAAAWPLAARAQQGRRTPRIGLLFGLAESDPRVRKYLGEFQVALRALGLVEGQNVHIDHRAGAGLEGMRSGAQELASRAPDLVVTYSTPATSAVRRAAPGTPIVFVAVSDPIGAGFVESLARPGGTITGFTNFEASMGSKWVELIRDTAPSVKRVLMLFDPTTANTGASGGLYLESMKAAAQVLGLELLVSPVNEPAGIDGAFAALAERREAGVVVTPNVFMGANRERIVAQAAKFRIPTVYPFREFVAAGGLLSYGVDYSDLLRRAATYAERMLRGDKPAELPVQQPTKFELIINLGAAKALGLEIPPTLLARADEVIE